MVDWYEYYDGTLCVHGGWLYKSARVLTFTRYKSYTQRGPFIIRRKGGGRGRPALIEWRSLHESYRQAIISRYGDPEKQAVRNRLTRCLKRDAEAERYFNAFQLDNGDYLPVANKAQYTAEAAILNALHELVSRIRGRRKTLGGGTAGLWEKAVGMVRELDKAQWPHKLPTNARSLRRKLNHYKQYGYDALVHKNFCNKNSEKVNEDAKLWLVARWSDRVKRVATLSQLFEAYNEKAEQEGWKKLCDEKTIYNFLYDEKITGLWYGYRHGELKFRERNSYQFSTRMPAVRDALWYGDGTKLNYFYRDADGKVKTCQVYEVMDAYSEVLLGYHISPTEDFAAQYTAYKMALQVAGHRPYQIGVDNQGGHKKLEAGRFLDKIARIAIKTQPYNAKSKTIESVFNRFQQRYLAQDWFFSGQNITAKKASSRANLEMIEANREHLPTLEQIKATYVRRRREWNGAAHPTAGLPRIELYQQSHNPEAPAVSLWQLVDWFWVLRPKAVTCTPYGIGFKDQGVRYDYMVHTAEGYPDQKWLRQHIDVRFFVKYDPEDRTYIHLYEQTPLGLRFVAQADSKVVIHRAKQDQQAWEGAYIQKVEALKKADRRLVRDTVDDILSKHSMHPRDYGMHAPHLKGIEAPRKRRRKEALGKLQKAVSQLVVQEEEAPQREPNIYELM